MPRNENAFTEFYRLVGARVRAERKAQRLSPTVFAVECGLSEPSLGKLERGATIISLARLCLIANALAVPVTALVPPEAAARLHPAANANGPAKARPLHGPLPGEASGVDGLNITPLASRPAASLPPQENEQR